MAGVHCETLVIAVPKAQIIVRDPTDGALVDRPVPSVQRLDELVCAAIQRSGDAVAECHLPRSINHRNRITTNIGMKTFRLKQLL